MCVRGAAAATVQAAASGRRSCSGTCLAPHLRHADRPRPVPRDRRCSAARSPDRPRRAGQSVWTTTATLTGTIDPTGRRTPCLFEYGTTTAYGLLTPQQTSGAGDDPVTVQAVLAGLTPATTYHFRLVAGDVPGADRRSPPPPRRRPRRRPSRACGADRTATSARLTALDRPEPRRHDLPRRVGHSTSFGNRTPDQPLPGGRRRGRRPAALAACRSHRASTGASSRRTPPASSAAGRTSFTTLRRRPASR